MLPAASPANGCKACRFADEANAFQEKLHNKTQTLFID